MKARTKTIHVKWEQCIGCGLCETACSWQHYHRINPELSRIRIHTMHPGPMSIPMICSYCSDRPCVRVCPEKALIYDESTHIIHLLKEKCLGQKCSICARACKGLRSDVIRFFPPDHDYPFICDRCDGDPQCVKMCPEDVLTHDIELFPGEYLADTVNKIAQDLSQRLLPASVKSRLKLRGKGD